MMIRHPRLRTTLAAATAAAALAAGAFTAAQAIADPESAPPVAAAPGQTPGAVYANQVLPAASLPAGASAGQRYSYWTTGVDERLHLAIATVVEPKGTAPAGGWPVVVNAPAGYGVAETCNASVSRDAADADTVTQLLRRGYAVITPDYGAIGASSAPQYIDHTVAARNIVDAVLAGVVVDGDVSPRWAILGDAQGAGAAIALARRAAAWQNGDVDFRGAAATSIPAGLDVLVSGLKPGSPAVSESVTADVVYALASLDAKQLESTLSPKGRQLVAAAKKDSCAPDLRKAVRGVALGDLVSKPIASNRTLARQLQGSLTLPRSGFSRPLLLSQTLHDDSVILHESLRFLADAQLASNKVTAKSYLTGDPSDAERQEQSAALTFLDKLF